MIKEYDSLAKPLPEGLAPPEAWPEYGNLAMPKTICAREEVGRSPKGIRWGIWPLYFEEYVSDEEPDMAAAKGKLSYSRFVCWKRLHRTDIPQGWHRFSKKSWRIDGYVPLEPEGDYVAAWDKKARYNLRLWEELERQGLYKIEDVSLKEFRTGFMQSTVNKKIGDELLCVLERKFALGFGEHFSVWGVREQATGRLIAGTAAAYSPTFKSSIRECSFILPEARKTYASTALIDHWFKNARVRGMRTLYFSHFKQRWDPRDWAGFSAFKAQFKPRYISHPPALWRFVRGKVF